MLNIRRRRPHDLTAAMSFFGPLTTAFAQEADIPTTKADVRL
jgi:hypothetical protein